MHANANLLHIRAEYDRCTADLRRSGLLSCLAVSGCFGVTGVDGKEYPMPSPGFVEELFAQHTEWLAMKIAQGFSRLEITPLAMPLREMMQVLEEAILAHGADHTIFQTRRSSADPLHPVRVNATKIVWIWETLRLAIEADELIYFPEKSAGHPRGNTKADVIYNRRICAVPGWSVGLAEALPILPGPGEGATIAGRKQLETGLSPREYLQILRTPPYQGETGRTLEEFITEFLIRLENTGEVSHDVHDSNALWFLGQYLKIPYAEVVPTGRWIRDLGRVRLDMHRTGNKKCTKAVGASTIVRLPSGTFS